MEISASFLNCNKIMLVRGTSGLDKQLEALESVNHHNNILCQKHTDRNTGLSRTK